MGLGGQGLGLGLDNYLSQVSPLSQERCRDGVEGEAVFLEPQRPQSGTEADLGGDEADLVTVEDELSGLQTLDLLGYRPDLVVGQVQDIQLLQVQERRREC